MSTTIRRKKKVCSVDGCEKPIVCKGFCDRHYRSFHKYGDPLVMEAFYGKPMRWILDHVNYTGDDCIRWPFGRSSNGYGRVSIGENKQGAANRVMCELANGPSPTPEHLATHNCGNGHLGCLNPRHLEWGTNSKNQMDRVRHGTSNRGERQGRAKLTKAQVLEIRAKPELSLQTLADRYGVARATILSVRTRKSWFWLW